MSKLLTRRQIVILFYFTIGLVEYHLFCYYLVNILTHYYTLTKPNMSECIKIILLNNFFIICSIFIVVNGYKNADNKKCCDVTFFVAGICWWIIFMMKDINDDLVNSLPLKDIYTYANKRFIFIVGILVGTLGSLLNIDTKFNK